jgi:hypothetical protein
MSGHNRTHTHTHTRPKCTDSLCRALGMAASMSMTVALPSVASAQRYTITPLVQLHNVPAVDTLGTAGINNKGQVVYTRWDSVSNTYHAWVWLPESDYGFSAGLTQWSVSNANVIARDINESGDVDAGERCRERGHHDRLGRARGRHQQ